MWGTTLAASEYEMRILYGFLSTSPVWGTTLSSFSKLTCLLISIHVPRVGDDAGRDHMKRQRPDISIHVPRVGDDLYSVDIPYLMLISIHVPRVGDDALVAALTATTSTFLSTSPVWGTTLA